MNIGPGNFQTNLNNAFSPIGMDGQLPTPTPSPSPYPIPSPSPQMFAEGANAALSPKAADQSTATATSPSTVGQSPQEEANVKTVAAVPLDYNLLNPANPLTLRIMAFAFMIMNVLDEDYKMLSYSDFMAKGLADTCKFYEESLANNSIQEVVCRILEIKPADQKDRVKLEEMVRKRAEIAHVYTSIMEQYMLTDTNQLQYRFNDNTCTDVPFPYADLTRAVGRVFKAHIEDEATIIKKGIIVDLVNARFYAKYEKGYVFIINSGEQIGNGSSCVVNRVFDICSGILCATKVMKGKDYNQYLNACQSLMEEVRVLDTIHKDGIKPGFQAPPFAVFEIYNENDASKRFVAALGPLYAGGDLYDWALKKDLTAQQRIDCCKSVIKIYKDLVQMGWVHGDYKPDNFLLDPNGNLYLSDFAGTWTHEKVIKERDIPEIASPEFHCVNDRVSISNEGQKKDIDPNDPNFVPELAFNPQVFLNLVKRHELFAIAFIQYYILFGQRPYASQEQAHPLFPEHLLCDDRYGLRIMFDNYKHMLQHYPMEKREVLKMLLRDMLEQRNPERRPTLEQALERWEAL